MPLIRLIRDNAFDPEVILVMSAAFEDALTTLHLVDREDPLVELVAKKVIECAQSGIHDRIRLRDCALRSFRQ